MLWADNPGTLSNGFYIPTGLEIGQDESQASPDQIREFLILSDDNRQPIQMDIERIEERQRMVNGRMRSYHIADKLKISTSWTLLPSRAFSNNPEFDSVTGKPTNLISEVNGKTVRPSGSAYIKDQQFTSDGGAGGVELLDWYNNHQGSFWVYLAYDNYKNFAEDGAQYNNLNRYNEVIEVFFADFNYSIEKRGGSNYDFWNVSVSLEEV
jgi:hypothetical protein